MFYQRAHLASQVWLSLSPLASLSASLWLSSKSRKGLRHWRPQIPTGSSLTLTTTSCTSIASTSWLRVRRLLQLLNFKGSCQIMFSTAINKIVTAWGCLSLLMTSRSLRSWRSSNSRRKSNLCIFKCQYRVMEAVPLEVSRGRTQAWSLGRIRHLRATLTNQAITRDPTSQLRSHRSC